MLNFTVHNYRTSKVCKHLTAKSMESIYAQYKRYCAGKKATSFIECDQSMSIGMGYWADENGHEFILR